MWQTPGFSDTHPIHHPLALAFRRANVQVSKCILANNSSKSQILTYSTYQSPTNAFSLGHTHKRAILMENSTTSSVSCPMIYDDRTLAPPLMLRRTKSQTTQLLTIAQPGPSSQPTDKTSQVGDQMRVVMSFAMQLERDMKKRREELYALATQLRTGRAELKLFEEEVVEYARLIEVDVQRPGAADKIRSSASELKQSQEIMEEAAKLVDQALAKIENRRGNNEE